MAVTHLLSIPRDPLECGLLGGIGSVIQRGKMLIEQENNEIENKTS
jgi:hypothetical protein